MTLTDWKKSSKPNEWINSDRTHHDVYVLVYPNGKDWTFLLSSQVWGDVKHKNFKTKSQALRYAKSYMKKHDDTIEDIED